VLVFCTNSGANRDPADTNGGTTETCRSYRRVGETEWRSLPEGIRNDHPFMLGKSEASAFVVKRVYNLPGGLGLPAVEWLDESGWRDDREPPTRGEDLAGPGGTIAPRRRVVAVLELRALCRLA
jgi:hypothetical protein